MGNDPGRWFYKMAADKYAKKKVQQKLLEANRPGGRARQCQIEVTGIFITI